MSIKLKLKLKKKKPLKLTAPTLQTVESAIETAAETAAKTYIMSVLVQAVPFFALGAVNPVVGWIVGWIVDKVGVMAIVEAGDIFIQLDTASQAASSSAAAAALQVVLNNPNSTPQEIQNAQQAMDTAYSGLINFDV